MHEMRMVWHCAVQEMSCVWACKMPSIRLQGWVDRQQADVIRLKEVVSQAAYGEAVPGMQRGGEGRMLDLPRHASYLVQQMLRHRQENG